MTCDVTCDAAFIGGVHGPEPGQPGRDHVLPRQSSHSPLHFEGVRCTDHGGGRESYREVPSEWYLGQRWMDAGDDDEMRRQMREARVSFMSFATFVPSPVPS